MARTASTYLLSVAILLWCYMIFVAWLSPARRSGPGGIEAGARGLRRDTRSPASMEKLPVRFRSVDSLVDPPPLAEIERNVTLYLNTLHAAFQNLQGTKAVPVDIWETYLDVTRSTMMKWDDQNRHRFPKPRRDNSIFVSLGTYRGELCV